MIQSEQFKGFIVKLHYVSVLAGPFDIIRVGRRNSLSKQIYRYGFIFCGDVAATLPRIEAAIDDSAFFSSFLVSSPDREFMQSRSFLSTQIRCR
jgi:hypothetical protein